MLTKQAQRDTETNGLVSYLDVGISVINGQCETTIYDKRVSFNFKIVNFPFMSSNIPSGPAYGIYISQLVRLGRIYSTYEEFNSCRNHFLCWLLFKLLLKSYISYIQVVSSSKVCY